MEVTRGEGEGYIDTRKTQSKKGDLNHLWIAKRLFGTVSEERDVFAPIHQAVEMELKAIESWPHW